MKKTIVTVAAACLFVVAGVSANSSTSTPEPIFVSSIASVNLSSFCKAIVQGDLDTVKKLIELGEDVNQKSLGMAPIHYAARYNKPEIMELLISNGANLKKRCDKGYSVKKHAELSSATEVLEVLKLAMKK
ncbi:ankyrin repeat domain-containing protein [Flagellimonas sp. 389]|uniref:ankyrin repeat domain-containing protein n=1 Tax=Flagellimonas sp. 389 TaxID=2835862 RepID=UPI001BD394D0|nr:ankyrin repeat domain-containing protein [Flagellimonas sp. 389]MBS9464220.1 ankyrin repeat domain-containing protein [Flagellimonas sp. 389]